MIFLRWSSHIASIVALFVCVAASVFAELPRQEQGAKPNPQRDSAPLTVPPPPARQIPVAKPQPNNPDTKPWYRDERVVWVGQRLWEIEWSNWALLVAAIIAAKLALRTLRTQTTQIKLQRGALSASRIAANASAKAATIAEQTMTLSHRAVVHVVGFKFHEFNAKHPQIEIRLMNSGALGAILTSGRIGYVRGALPDVPQPTSMVNMSLSAIIPPNVTATPLMIPFGDVFWDQTVWKDIIHGKIRVSFYGSIAYETGLLNASGETGFGFEFDHGMTQEGDYASRFVTSAAPGYNYTK